MQLLPLETYLLISWLLPWIYVVRDSINFLKTQTTQTSFWKIIALTYDRASAKDLFMMDIKN